MVNPMLRVADLAEQHVPQCEPDLLLTQAVAKLAIAKSGWLAVVQKEKPIGVLSERNVVNALARSSSDFAHLTVEQAMSREFSRVREDATLETLIEAFGARGTLVIDKHGGLAGVIYWQNLVGKLSERGLGRVLIKLLEREGRAT
ncbi:MAG TPA: CBS domain-containing protein [Pirellulales bacterium]|nr:CBS domain-containing protein [Pirellulales bacterium]